MPTGIYDTAMYPQDLVKKSFASMITRLMPNGTAPLFGLTSMLQDETAVATEHGFFTKTMLFPQLQVTAAGQLSTDTTWTVTDTANLLPGMLMQVDTTKEIILINSVISSTQITVARGMGTVAAAAVGASVFAYQVGNAFEEGSTRPAPQNVIPVRITNLTQIFRNSWATTGTVQAVQVIAGDSTVSENRQDCAALHAADIEKALFFGQKLQSTRNGKPYRQMDGLINIVGNLAYYPPSYAAANVFTAGATTNFTQLQGFFDPMFNQTTDPKVANDRVVFVGGGAKLVLNEIGRLNGSYFMVDGQTDWGLQFSTFKLARGTLRVIEHPLFNTNAAWRKMAVAVDLTTFRVAYLNGRKTSNQEYGTNGTPVDNGIDAVGGTLTTEMTCVVKNPPANAVVYNLTAAAQG